MGLIWHELLSPSTPHCCATASFRSIVHTILSKSRRANSVGPTRSWPSNMPLARSRYIVCARNPRLAFNITTVKYPL